MVDIDSDICGVQNLSFHTLFVSGSPCLIHAPGLKKINSGTKHGLYSGEKQADLLRHITKSTQVGPRSHHYPGVTLQL